jgi:hypothetical protein
MWTSFLVWHSKFVLFSAHQHFVLMGLDSHAPKSLCSILSAAKNNRYGWVVIPYGTCSNMSIPPIIRWTRQHLVNPNPFHDWPQVKTLRRSSRRPGDLFFTLGPSVQTKHVFAPPLRASPVCSGRFFSVTCEFASTDNDTSTEKVNERKGTEND